MRRAALELRESELRYRGVVDHVREVVFQTDAAGRWTFLNPAWSELTGFSAAESIGEPFAAFVHPDDRQLNVERFAPLMRREVESCEHEHRYVTRGGAVRWVQVRARLILDGENRVAGVTGLLSDVTEHKRSRDALAEQRVIRALAEASSEDEALRAGVEAIGEALGWQCGVLWTRPEGGLEDGLLCLSVWSEDSGRPARRREEETPGATLAPGVGLPGRVARSGVAEWARSASEEAAQALAAPIRAGDEVIGVIELLSAEAKPRDDGLPELVAALADRMGRCAERMRVRRREIEHMTSIAAVAQGPRELNATTDAARARRAVCAAARQVIAADVVELWEPERDELVCTATAGADPPAGGLRMGREASGAGVAFASAQRFFVPDVSGQPAISARMIERTGARSVMFEPVAREGEVIAVLVLIWTTPTPGIGRQSEAMLGLLSGEAAAAIGRADLLHELEELARTDSLTGIANRRTWEAELRRELVRAPRVERPLCVAIVDLDFFKRFNDTRGHQDGDRLLKSSAAAWSGALREADFLARYGGEEFGVILPGCGLGDARTVVDRLRSVTPSGQTCSAGIAEWDGRESVEALVARADAALYEAKAAGRDRTAAA